LLVSGPKSRSQVIKIVSECFGFKIKYDPKKTLEALLNEAAHVMKSKGVKGSIL